MTINAPVGPPICTFFGTNPRSDTESYGKRKGYDAYDDACHQVGHKVSFRVIPKRIEELRFELKRFHAY